MDIESLLLRSIREKYKAITGFRASDYKSLELVNIRNQEVSDIVISAIENNWPFLLSRFGSEEIKWYVHYKLLSSPYPNRVLSYITCKTETWKKRGRIIDNMTVQPKNLVTTKAFVEAMDEAISEIDLLGSWLKLEQSPQVSSRLTCENYAFLIDIEPYYHTTPWSSALEQKRVLVIHPMESSIKSQYHKRKLLHKNPQTLPDFELITIKAKYFDDPIYNSWQKIYDFYLESIHKIDFDVAIIGCGSWGMPVAAKIKKLGKQALHLGGATQNLFGIIGKRWKESYIDFNTNFINDHWVSPQEEETPTWAKNYDNNSYW